MSDAEELARLFELLEQAKKQLDFALNPVFTVTVLDGTPPRPLPALTAAERSLLVLEAQRPAEVRHWEQVIEGIKAKIDAVLAPQAEEDTRVRELEAKRIEPISWGGDAADLGGIVMALFSGGTITLKYQPEGNKTVTITLEVKPRTIQAETKTDALRQASRHFVNKNGEPFTPAVLMETERNRRLFQDGTRPKE